MADHPPRVTSEMLAALDDANALVQRIRQDRKARQKRLGIGLDMKIVIVAAVARNGVIGKAGVMPWHLPEDLKHFRSLTMGKAVVMGRRTWDSLPQASQPLPGRRNVVLTRSFSDRLQMMGVSLETASSLEQALEMSGPEVYIIGGAEVYRQALPLADELVLTEIDRDFEGDTRFPEFDRSQFEKVSCVRRLADEPSGLRFAFTTYRRKGAQ